MNKTRYFLQILKKAEKRFGSSSKRLAGDAWPEAWQTLIATILSAQSRDEVTIPVAENLFKKYYSLEKLAKATRVSKATFRENLRKAEAKLLPQLVSRE